MEVHFNMSKLTREQKIEIYRKRKQGQTLETLSKEYLIRKDNIKYLVRLIDTHGEDILKREKNNYYSPLLKEEMINKVLKDRHSINSVSLEYGLISNGLLFNWIKAYKANGYGIVEKMRGRSPTMAKKTQSNKEYKDMTPEEKVKYLEDKNLYLEAELEYIKKLRAVVQARKDQQPKKK